MGWIFLLLGGGLLWLFVRRGLQTPVAERLAIALELTERCEFSVAPEFDAECDVEPYLVAWLKSGTTSVKLFRAGSSDRVRETVEMTTWKFRPNLVVRYYVGSAEQIGCTGKEPPIADSLRVDADRLLTAVRDKVEACKA